MPKLVNLKRIYAPPPPSPARLKLKKDHLPVKGASAIGGIDYGGVSPALRTVGEGYLERYARKERGISSKAW